MFEKNSRNYKKYRRQYEESARRYINFSEKFYSEDEDYPKHFFELVDEYGLQFGV